MGKCVEEFVVGDVAVSPARTVTETDVVMYSWVSGDLNPMHTDAVFAGASPIGARIAHGTLGMSIVTGLSSRIGDFDGTAVAAIGVYDWTFLAPIFINDTVHLRATVQSARVSASKPDRGVVERLMELVNQDGTVVQLGIMKTMTLSRAGVAASAPFSGKAQSATGCALLHDLLPQSQRSMKKKQKKSKKK